MTSKQDEYLPQLKIRYSGVFDWDNIYDSIIDWLKRYRFYVHESSYKHKVPSPLGAEQEYEVYGTVEVNEFVRFRINITAHLWDVTLVEKAEGNKKKSMTSARLEMRISGIVEFDWQNKFEKNRITRALRSLYLGVIYRRDASTIWTDMLYYRMVNLHAYIKKMLSMQTKKHIYKGYLGESE